MSRLLIGVKSLGTLCHLPRKKKGCGFFPLYVVKRPMAARGLFDPRLPVASDDSALRCVDMAVLRYHPESRSGPSGAAHDGKGCAGWTTSAAQPAASVPRSAASIRVATFNVLSCRFPLPIRLAIDSATRFDSLVDEIEKVNSDVVCLNEVDTTSYERLLRSDVMRWGVKQPEDGQRRGPYAVTPLFPDALPEGDGDNSSASRPSHGCVIFARVPVLCSFWIDGAVRGRCPVAVTLDVSEPLTIAAVHSAAYQTAACRSARAEQLYSVAVALRQRLARGATSGGPSLTATATTSFIVCGDLNLHDDAEDRYIVDNALLDLWLETHAADRPALAETGYTFDAVANTMIPRYIPGEQRQMRLDRILINKGALWRPVSPVEIWANRPIDAYRQLFLSDHFGLVVNLALCTRGDEFFRCPQAKSLQERRCNEPLRKELSKGRFLMALPRHCAWLAGRTVGVW